MIPDKVIYTDGHDVVVTDATLKVKNMSYRLNGITKLCLWTIRPDRWPGVVLVVIGLVAAVAWYTNMLPADLNMQVKNGYITANTVMLWGGAVLAAIGILALALSKERYAVRIGTAEGDKNAVISYKREYISQIVDALHSAFDLREIPVRRVIASKK